MECVKAAVCDDIPAVCAQVQAMLEEILGEGSCQAFCECGSFFQEMEDGTYFDVVIMGIEWGGEEKGFSAAAVLNEYNPDTRVIFMTGHPEKYVEQAFLHPVNLCGFLVEPVRPESLRGLLEKCLKNDEEKKRFAFQYKGSRYSLDVDGIRYLESAGHRIRLFTAQKTYQLWGKLDDLEASFPSHFIRCHKSYLVNMDWMWKLDARHRFILEDGSEIPVSRQHYPLVRQAYLKYSRKQPDVSV